MKISVAEHERRKAAINYARASSRLEGVSPNPELDGLNALYINGDIDRPTLNKAVLSIFKQ